MSPRIVFLTMLRKTKHLFIYTFVTCILILMCWGVFYSAKKLMNDGDRFKLESIAIHPMPNNHSFFNYQNIPEITGLKVNDNLLSHNLSELERKLEAYPELVNATLRRELPGAIEITLVEREVVAKLKYNGAMYFIDKDGKCFKPQISNPTLSKTLPVLQTQHSSDLPFQLDTKEIQGVGLERALAFSEKWKVDIAFGERIVKVKVRDLHSLLVETESGAELIFGYYEHDRQIQDFNTILYHANEQGLKLKSANLLPFENIPVTYDESVKKPKKKVEVVAPPKKEINSDLMKILNQG